MKNPWYEVLEALYEHDELWEMEASQVSQLAELTELEEEQVEETLENLENQELIKRELDTIILTKRGFDLISQKETHEEQLLTERLLLVFVTALSLGTLMDTAIAVGQTNNVFLQVAYNALFAIIFIVLGMIAKQNMG
ncbi:MAG: hypothetical protein ABEJ75_03680 [Candidatus Nanohaloarchaea archaeon]